MYHKAQIRAEPQDLAAFRKRNLHLAESAARESSLISIEIASRPTIGLQPNICSFISVVTDPQHLYLVLEYVNGGDMLEYIMKKADPGPGLGALSLSGLTRWDR